MPEKITLSHRQRQNITTHLESFKAYVQTPAFQKDQAQRLSHVTFFQETLPERLAEFSEAELTEIVTKLWASRIWGNKQYHVQNIIADNGLDKLREEFAYLLDRSKHPGERYERFLSQIKRLGPASVTEILCYIEPDRCGIWNRKAREGFEILGLDDWIDPEKYRISGDEYETFNATLQALAEKLQEAGFENVDLLFVDFFLYQVAQTEPKLDKGKEAVLEEFDHDEIRDLIASIGEMMGFESQTELRIAHGAQVDVVWRARIGNLGIVTYVFEVHRSGTIDSLLLNLQKARSNPTVQKVIAVSDDQRLQEIRNETEGLPEEFRKVLGFWPVSDVQEVGDKLQAVDEIIERLGLVQGDLFK